MLPLTPEDALRIDNNPDLMHVGIVDGRLWLSEDARADIEMLTGRDPDEHDCPRRMMELLQSHCRHLQSRDDHLDRAAAERNFMQFCVLKGLEHAIATKLLGTAHVGVFRPERLVEAFFVRSPASEHGRATFH